LNLDNSCVKLRAATFFLTNFEYSQAIKICDTFLTFPPRHKVQVAFGVERSSYIYAKDKILRLRQQLSKVKTTEEIENIKTEILPMFYASVKLKSLSRNYDITNVAARNFTQELSRFNDFLISRFDSSNKSVLFDSLYFA
jgi:hypothetical protein